ncbi:MAG: arginine--tRNA ligase [Christensenellaceae bacterium]
MKFREGPTGPPRGKGKTVCIDYSSINIAVFHIGHLSTTVLGGALYRILNFLGYKAVGINHLGDYGTQFGKLISAYKRWGDEQTVEKGGIRALNELYVRFHREAEAHPEYDDEARAYFKKIEDGDEECLALFRWFKELTLKDVQKIYALLDIRFDSYAGESFYSDKMQPVVDELKEKGLLVESRGAQVVELEDYGMPPCIILKSDGSSLYATRDMAAAIYRKETYDFINVSMSSPISRTCIQAVFQGAGADGKGLGERPRPRGLRHGIA